MPLGDYRSSISTILGTFGLFRVGLVWLSYGYE